MMFESFDVIHSFCEYQLFVLMTVISEANFQAAIVLDLDNCLKSIKIKIFDVKILFQSIDHF